MNRETVYGGLSNAAWGYFFLHIDFNLGFNQTSINVLPRFVGWLLLLSAIGKLAGERRDLPLLRPLGRLLAAWTGADWLLNWAGQTIDGHILFLDLLVSAAAIYFHFQFLSDMAALAERYEPPEGTLAARLRRRRTMYVLVVTLVNTLHYLPVSGESELRNYAALGVMLVLVGVLAALFVMTGLFALRRLFRDQPEDLPQI